MSKCDFVNCKVVIVSCYKKNDYKTCPIWRESAVYECMSCGKVFRAISPMECGNCKSAAIKTMEEVK